MTAEEAPLAQYLFRRSVLEQHRTYLLYPDRIVVESGEFPAQTYPLGEVESVRLKYERTKQRAYYQCFIRTRRGRIALHHLSWQSFGKFEDRRAAYTPFVRAVLAQLAQQPNVRFRAGSTANFIGAIAGIPLMAFLAVLAVQFDRSGPAILAGSMLVLCLLMLGPSRPRRFDPLAPPTDLLPE